MNERYSDQVQQWVREFVAWRDRKPDESDLVLDGVRTLKLHRPTRALISTEPYIIPIERRITSEDIHTVIGAAALDTVMLADGVHVMCVDDHAVAKKLPINALATRFYHQKCGGEVPFMIRGDVVIVPDSDFAMPNGEPFRSHPL